MRKTILACVAVALVASTATATAASLITSEDIKNGTIQNKDIKKGTIKADRLSPGVRAQLEKHAAAGPAGAQGAKGDTGARGAHGARGMTGATGAAGANGQKGGQGVQGAQGIQGLQGENGDKGHPGEKGEKGDKGDRGEKGEKGDKGDPGEKGDKGDRGANADGSTTTPVTRDGDGGAKIFATPGSGGDNGEATIEGDNLRLKINAPGGGFASASVPASGKVADLRTLVYKFATLARADGSKVAPTLKIDVTGAVSGTDDPGAENNRPPFAEGATTLVFEPTYTENMISGGTLDTLAPTSNWWSTRSIKGAVNRDKFVPIATILAGNPDITIKRLYLDAGQNSDGAPWSGFDGTVDWLRVNNTRYDFGV